MQSFCPFAIYFRYLLHKFYVKEKSSVWIHKMLTLPLPVPLSLSLALALPVAVLFPRKTFCHILLIYAVGVYNDVFVYKKQMIFYKHQNVVSNAEKYAL